MEKNDEDADGAKPQASLEPPQASEAEDQTPGEEEAASTHPLASLPSKKRPGAQAEEDHEGPSQGPVDREKGPSAEQGPQAEREEEEEAEAGEKAVPEEEGPHSEAFDSHPSLGYKEMQRGESMCDAWGSNTCRGEGMGGRGPHPSSHSTFTTTLKGRSYLHLPEGKPRLREVK